MVRSKRRDDIQEKKRLRRIRREKWRQRDAINASILTPPVITYKGYQEAMILDDFMYAISQDQKVAFLYAR